MCFDCTNADFSDFDPDYCVEPTDEDDERFWFKKDEAEDQACGEQCEEEIFGAVDEETTSEEFDEIEAAFAACLTDTCEFDEDFVAQIMGDGEMD